MKAVLRDRKKAADLKALNTQVSKGDHRGRPALMKLAGRILTHAANQEPREE